MIRFDQVHDALLVEYGPQRWWPADDVFEIMVGALLVQRTAWRNVEHAIARLKSAGLLDPDGLSRTRVGIIEPQVKGTGFSRTKACRLKDLAAFVVAQGGTESFGKLSTREMRALLLQVGGIGPETADAILLYAYNRPVVVVDEYLRRLAKRLLCFDQAAVSDQRLREWVAGTIADAAGLNELHALVIVHGQRSCGRIPECGRCAIRTMCGTARNALQA
jgi:endonuclease-3 related protein